MNQSLEPTQPVFLPAAQSGPSRLGRALITLAGGIALFALAVAFIPLAYSASYNGRIFPGVSVAGINVSGLTQEEAAQALAGQLTYDRQAKIYFQDGVNIWQATPHDLGFMLDSQSSAAAAYQIGRSADPFTRLTRQLYAYRAGINIAPVALYNEQLAQEYLQSIAAEIDRPVVDAFLEVSGTDVVVRAGQTGRSLDVPAALASLQQQLPAMTDAIVPLIIHETPPVILDASEQADLARSILSAPLKLQLPEAASNDPGPWHIDQAGLAKMLVIEKATSPEGIVSYQVALNTQDLRAFLEGIAPSLVRFPANPRFVFNDETRQLELIQSAIIGRALDIEASIGEIQAKLLAGEHDVTLEMAYTNPGALDTSTAESLGIREAVSVYTSYFFGSSGPRIQNIVTASARFHGVLVAPGETFSMANVLGDVSLDSGYAEALIIYGDRTIKGVGGGVCQVSTTLFRTAFFGGYPVAERYAHAYRVTYYEQTPSGGINTELAGLDATVFAPVVDFKFTNNSDAWLLMETYVNEAARTLTWKFYSTDDGRTVEWQTTGLRNVTEPPEPLYEENAGLAKGEIKQVDWAVEGADVHVTRTVYRNGDVLFSDTFNTHYVPWRARYQYGPGTEDIPGIDDEEDNEDADGHGNTSTQTP
ncbi:MAG: VanW family protein [Chloroflexota bacterium]